MVSKNGKIVWKRRLQGPFYAHVEIQAILGPILLYRASNISKQKHWVIKTVFELLFYLSIWLISECFPPQSRYKHAKIKSCQKKKIIINKIKKCCKSSKKQSSTMSNTKWRTKLVDHKSFYYFTQILKIL